jgi:tRNA(fMet)-specific endonuclease VapC
MAQLIDTSVLIAVERQGRSLADLRAELTGEEIAIAAITASELLVGTHFADAARRQQREAYVEDVLESIALVYFDLHVARIHARLVYEMSRAGLQIGAHDLQIAATAVADDYGLVTLNVREFRRVPGLSVYPYP